jgi:hypothetical protein
MHISNIRMLFIAVLCVMSTACAHVSPQYSASAVDVEEIRLVSNGTSKISVGNFTAAKDVESSITCRGEGPVSPPNNKTFQAYFRDALVEELNIAGILSETSDRNLTATLDRINFSSAMTGGDWDISMTFSSKGVEPFVISIIYPFDSSFVAATACQQVAEALPQATQKLISELIKHPSFKSLIRGTS